MCGIAGIIYLNGQNVVESEIKTMTDALVHRGPDGEGRWVADSGKIGFGHRRLSILDLSENGSQPMHFKDRYTITFNGEIYNYLEIKKDLIQKGYEFKSNSDTEVLLALYDAKGEDLLQELDGMFAFAIWDSEKQELFCARDRFGEKPFYYFQDENKFVFASEMKAIWAYGIPKIWDQKRLNQFKEKSAVYDKNDLGATFFQGIRQLKHASYLLLDLKGESKTIQYYTIDRTKVFLGSFEEAVGKFKSLFSLSISRRLRSDVPVGSSLSGGLDSSAVVAEISDQLLEGQEQFTFSAKFPGFEKDEGKFAEMVVKKFENIEGVDVFPNKKELFDDLDRLLEIQEEPVASSSIFAQWSVFKKAKNKVKVMLDGQGADEYLAGYNPFYKDYLNQLFWWDRPTYKEELEAYNQNKGQNLKSLLENETLRMKLGRLKVDYLGGQKPFPKSHLKDELHRILFEGSLQSLLKYADRNAMGNSIETRLPFLFHELVEFCFSLPDEYLLKLGWSKYILRKSFEGKLPAEIIWRKDKVGFEPPQKEWLGSKDENYTNDQVWKDLIIQRMCG